MKGSSNLRWLTRRRGSPVRICGYSPAAGNAHGVEPVNTDNKHGGRMAVIHRIQPSPQARQLYNKMVARSEDCHLALEDALALGVELHRLGEDPKASIQVGELISEEWIRPADDGGWHLG